MARVVVLRTLQHKRMYARCAETLPRNLARFTILDRYGKVDAGFRDPSGNGWKLIEAASRANEPN